MLSLSLLLLFATTAVAQQQGTQDLLSQADEVFQQMSQITGLPIKTPLRKQVVSRPEIEKYLTQNLHEEMTPAEIHAQEALVRSLGLVSRDFNLEKFLISFYTEQAAGFYDPKRKTMFIADWIPAETQTMVLSTNSPTRYRTKAGTWKVISTALATMTMPRTRGRPWWRDMPPPP